MYKGSEGVFFGSARMTQESRETIDRLHKNEEIERKKRELENKRKLMENEIEALKERYARDEEEMKILIGQDISRRKMAEGTEKEIATTRHVDR